MSPRRRNRLLTIGAVIVLLAAILPNVLWLGHWSVPGLQVTSQAVAAHDHASHCHGDPSCADQPAGFLPWWPGSQDTLVLDNGSVRATTAGPEREPAEPVTPSLDPPPRPA